VAGGIFSAFFDPASRLASGMARRKERISRLRRVYVDDAKLVVALDRRPAGIMRDKRRDAGPETGQVPDLRV